jgi:hypothetical protein
LRANRIDILLWHAVGGGAIGKYPALVGFFKVKLKIVKIVFVHKKVFTLINCNRPGKG